MLSRTWRRTHIKYMCDTLLGEDEDNDDDDDDGLPDI